MSGEIDGVTLFYEAYAQVADKNNGGFRPEHVAQIIAEQLGLPQLTSELTRLFREPNVPETTYADTLAALDFIVKQQQLPLVIWTQGELRGDDGVIGYQVLKIHRGGFDELLAPDWEQLNTQHNFPAVVGGFDKIDALRTFWQERLAADAQTVQPEVVIVDDKIKNVQAALAILTELGISAQGVLIDRKGKHQDEAQTNTFHVITSLAELPGLVNGVNQVVFCDLDYTLIDHALVKQYFAQQLAISLQSTQT